MDRRIFTQSSVLAALGVLVSPLVGFQLPLHLRHYRAELPEPVLAHLDLFAGQMQQGLALPLDHPLIQKCVVPIHIQELECRGNTYRFKYSNRYGQTIALSCDGKKLSTFISLPKESR